MKEVKLTAHGSYGGPGARKNGVHATNRGFQVNPVYELTMAAAGRRSWLLLLLCYLCEASEDTSSTSSTPHLDSRWHDENLEAAILSFQVRISAHTLNTNLMCVPAD